MDIKYKIKEYCKKLGLDTVGVTKCREFSELKEMLFSRKEKGFENEFEENDINKRINPNIYMKEGRAIISIAFPYMFTNDLSHKEIYFSKYTWGRDYHRVVSNYLKKVCSFIENLGYRANFFVDSNALPERYIASLCGIGFIGKNNMLITEKYGSYVFLGEIITDLDLKEDKGMETKCGNCRLCLDSCPTKSINDGYCNSNICLSYLTQKKDLDELWFNKINGRLFGCDSCQRACPYNHKITLSTIKDFTPFDFMKNIDASSIINISNSEFKNKYAITSCGWRGKNVLIRNVLINQFTFNKNIKLDRKFKSQYLNDYYSRLLRLYKL